MQSPLRPLPPDSDDHGPENTGNTCRSLILEKLAIAPLDGEGGLESPLSCRLETPNENSVVSVSERPPSPTQTSSPSVGAPSSSQTAGRLLTIRKPVSPLQSISRKLSWRNMESIRANAQPMTRTEPVSSPLRSVARNISWSNMEVLDDIEPHPKKTTPVKSTDDTRRGRKKTLRKKSSSLSNLAREQNLEKPSRKSPNTHTPTRPKTERRTVRPQRSSSLGRLDRPKQLSPKRGEQSGKPRKQKTVGKSLSLRRKGPMSPSRNKKNVSEDIRPRKRSSETNDGSRSPRRLECESGENNQQADRRQSPLRAVVRSLSKRSFRAFSPTKSRQDEADTRTQKKTPRKVKNEESKPRGESPLKAVARTLSLRRLSSPTKARGDALDIRPKDNKKTREASRSPNGKGRRSLGLSLDKHLSHSPFDRTNQNDCYSVASSTVGSRLQRTKSLMSLCSTTETAAVDTSTMAAAAIAAEEVRSCSPERRNSGFHIRSSSFRTQSSATSGSPVRRRSPKPGDPLSSSMHSLPRRVPIEDTGVPLSQSSHTPTKGLRKQLSTRSIPVSPKSDPAARKLSLSPLRVPEPPLSPKTAAAGLSISLHGDSTHRRVRGMRHPPKTKHNNLNRSLHGGSLPL